MYKELKTRDDQLRCLIGRVIKARTSGNYLVFLKGLNYQIDLRKQILIFPELKVPPITFVGSN